MVIENTPTAVRRNKSPLPPFYDHRIPSPAVRRKKNSNQKNNPPSPLALPEKIRYNISSGLIPTYFAEPPTRTYEST